MHFTKFFYFSVTFFYVLSALSGVYGGPGVSGSNPRSSFHIGATQSIPKCPTPLIPGGGDAKYKYDRETHEERVFQALPDGAIVIIGAGLGEMDFTWELMKKNPSVKKIFVEPIFQLADNLKENVRASGIKNSVVVHAAISFSKGHTEIYCWDTDRLEEHNLPQYFSQICSFNRSRLYMNEHDTAEALKHLSKDQIEELAKKYIISVPVNKVTMHHVLRDQLTSYSQATVVQVDTEGFDHRVVQMLPFHDPQFRPCLVMWEGVMLTVKRNLELIQMITSYGYGVSFDKKNIIMYRIL